MKKVIQITLSGHPTPFTLSEDAGRALQAYLDRARSRLESDPDREEVLSDLEQSIAEKLTRQPAAVSHMVSRNEIESALEEMGAVDTDTAEAGVHEVPINHQRRLRRIKQGRWLAGVCQGLAAYSSIHVGWVRLAVVILGVFAAFLSTIPMIDFSAWTLMLSILIAWFPVTAYVVLAFVLPVTATRDEYLVDCNRPSNAV